MYHWSNLQSTDTLFVMIFDKCAAWIFNVVVLTAALSVCNSCIIYSNSRMLYGLVLQIMLHKCSKKITKKGVPATVQLLSFVLVTMTLPQEWLIKL